MAAPLPLFPLLTAALAAATATVLALSALRHWWAERAGRPYELPVNRTGTAVRATAAALAAVAAAAVLYPYAGWGARPAHNTAAHTPVRAPLRAPLRAPAPAPAPRPAPTPEPPARPRTIAHPADGTLQQLADGTHIWLPAQYGYASAADLDFPLVIAYAPRAQVNDLLTAFAAHTDRGLADPFVVVLPSPDRCGTPTPAKLLDGYRIAPARTARALLGLGDEAAPCAVTEALTHPGRYEAVAAASATYDRPPPPHDRARTQLLLATPAGDEARAASALRLRDALRAAGPGEVRILDGIDPPRRLLALIAGYFTEKLDGPAHPNHP